MRSVIFGMVVVAAMSGSALAQIVTKPTPQGGYEMYENGRYVGRSIQLPGGRGYNFEESDGSFSGQALRMPNGGYTITPPYQPPRLRAPSLLDSDD
jgi:hypothetical protein